MRIPVLSVLFLVSLPVLAEQPDPIPTEPAPAPSASAGRLLLNTVVVGAGLGLATAGAYNLTQANGAYGDYLAEADASQAAAFLQAEVRPRQVAGITELGLAVVCIGAGAVLWGTTDHLQVGVGPGSVRLAARF